jgi:hypothetical protein
MTPRMIGRTGLGLDLNLEVLGDVVASEHLDRIAERALDLETPFEDVIHDLEAAEIALFARLQAKDPPYQPPGGSKSSRRASGRLRASLTGTSPDALREAHHAGLVFGTKVFYGRFQRTPRKFNASTKGESAILKLPVAVKKLAARKVIRYVVHGSL